MFDRNRKILFNREANDYNEIRPDYPEELIDDLILLSSIPPGGKILEIGCGTGKATVMLASRGYNITGIELGDNLAEYARMNCRDFKNVSIRTVSFENAILDEKAFDVVTSAQAFHWLDPAIRFKKVSGILKDTGSIALFWNQYLEPSDDVNSELSNMLQRVSPELFGKNGPTCEELIEIRKNEIISSGLFCEPIVKAYPWRHTYTTEQVIRLHNTYSDFLSLESSVKDDVKRKMSDIVDKHGGKITKSYLAVLYLARKI